MSNLKFVQKLMTDQMMGNVLELVERHFQDQRIVLFTIISVSLLLVMFAWYGVK